MKIHVEIKSKEHKNKHKTGNKNINKIRIK